MDMSACVLGLQDKNEIDGFGPIFGFGPWTDFRLRPWSQVRVRTKGQFSKYRISLFELRPWSQMVARAVLGDCLGWRGEGWGEPWNSTLRSIGFYSSKYVILFVEFTPDGL